MYAWFYSISFQKIYIASLLWIYIFYAEDTVLYNVMRITFHFIESYFRARQFIPIMPNVEQTNQTDVMFYDLISFLAVRRDV